MRIGIDIDGVLTNIEQFTLDYLSKYCVEHNIDYKIGKSDYEASKTFGIQPEQEDVFWDAYIDFYARCEKARPFASEVIKKLSADGNTIYIITARYLTNREDAAGEKMRKIVQTWLLKNDIRYDKLIFSKAKKEKKTKEIIENKIDIMIEDNPNNIMELSKILPIICYDTTYNKECKGDRIYRCYSWYDIYKTINQILTKKES